MAAESGSVRAGSNRSGLLVGALTYFMWGLFPFYFVLVEPAGPFEVVAFRITFSMLFCVVLVTLTRGWRSLLNVARNPRTLGALGIASVLITANWTIYISAVFTNNTAEASLGYFINPLVSTLLGVLVLKEQLTPAQWVAAGLGLVAVIVISVGYGRLPLFGLGLAFSFGLYGLAKNRVGGKVKPIEGLALETAWMTPAAVVFLSVMGGLGLLTFPKLGWGFTGLLMLSGVVTAIPLLTFAFAASRLRLVTLGMIQYISPIMLFIVGVWVFGEPMSGTRWAGFALVWAAVVVLMVDAVWQARVTRHLPRAAAQGGSVTEGPGAQAQD
ncbi:EamA family transporter RarD [Pseudoglutamicibacter cumminsii]|uniref:EamA family transporter RarD n=1 Tax=Pseudoglutamicibacter cumminsii TaxID=156979 RepID=UPI0025526FF5|nr:EamA family transporter RarD [Pseudoglutamicibacter cumminsii]MDK7083021.1 EamA family transporter RarD [Pseudoglutamicibacter cumminsii]